MLVIVVPVGGVPVSAMDVIDVIAVLNGIVAAAGFVRVAVIGVGYMRKRVLVVVALVRRVRVTIVYIVGMSVMLDASVPAAWPVFMRVLCMNGVRIGNHRSPVVLLLLLSLAGFCPWAGSGRRKLALELRNELLAEGRQVIGLRTGYQHVRA